MRIGIDCRFYDLQNAGLGRYTSELVRNLLKLDKKDEFILFFNRDNADQFKSRQKNVEKVVVDIPHYSLAEQFKLPGILKKYRLDLMHFTHFNHSIFWLGPSIFNVHDLTLSFFPGRGFNNPLKKFAYELTLRSALGKGKKIIALSKNTKDEIVKYYKVEPDKIVVIYPGVDQYSRISPQSRKINAVKRKYKITKPYFLYTGQWRIHKNLIRLVEAFYKLVKEKKLDAQLVIAGKKDSAFPQLPNRIRDLRLGRKVILTGFVEDKDLPCLYTGARVFVFPSLAEGFGLPPLEAMALGIPVVSSDASCMPEVLGKAALYFEPRDIDDIAEKMEKIFKDENLRMKLSRLGIKQAKKYRWEKLAKEILILYSKIKNDYKNIDHQ